MSSIITDIIEGKHDDELDAIYNAYRTRSKLVAQTKNAVGMTAFKVGDKARIVSTCKPKKLAGALVTITDRNPQTFVVHIDGSPEWETFRCPPALLEKVGA